MPVRKDAKLRGKQPLTDDTSGKDLGCSGFKGYHDTNFTGTFFTIPQEVTREPWTV